MTLRLLVTIILLYIPAHAIASDFRGVIAFAYLLIVVSIFTAINIALMITFHSRGKYLKKSFTNTHVSIASIIPILGVVLTLADSRGGAQLFTMLGLNFLALLITMVPLALHKNKTQNTSQITNINSEALLTLSTILLLSSIYFIPSSLLSVAISHSTLKNVEGIKKKFNYALLVAGYISVCHSLAILSDLYKI